jgi:hypothetical protein
MATEVASECGDRIFDLAGVAHPDHAQLRTDGRYGLDCGKLTNSGGHVGISQHRDPCQGRCDLFEQLQPFSRDRVLEYGEAGGVAENQLCDVQEAATRLGVAWHGSATFVLSSDVHAQNAAPSRMHVVYSQATRRNGSELSRQHVAWKETAGHSTSSSGVPLKASQPP